MMKARHVLILAALGLSACATGQDVNIGVDIVRVIPHDRAVSFLQKAVRSYHTGYECKVFDDGIVFPQRSGMPNYGLMPYGSLKAHSVWASWSSGGSGLVVLAEGVTGLIGADRCILYIHPNPGPLGTRPPPDTGMQTALEAVISLGATYKLPPESADGSLRVFMPVGL